MANVSMIGFSRFLDDSAAWADLVLPDHDPLESEIALVPAVSDRPSVTLAQPFIAPLYETRAVEKTLADVARKLEVEYQVVAAKDLLPEGAKIEDAARQGGWWGEPKSEVRVSVAGKTMEVNSPAFEGSEGEYPTLFQPYLSLQFHDGSGSHLPWMQELPDPASSAIWGLPVEIDSKTAAGLRIANGDIVRVQSPHGSIDAPAYVHPGAVPGVVRMPIGDGHSHYGRYATGRGANPISILAPVWEKSTGALVMGGTRVRVSRVGGAGKWIQFSMVDRQERGFDHR